MERKPLSGRAEEGTDYCQWWLRSPGSRASSAIYIGYNGNINYYGESVDDTIFMAVRPAMWISIEP